MPRRRPEYDPTELTRRESQIMEVLYRRDVATAEEIREELADPPGYSSVRKLLEIMEDRGLVAHEEEGPRYVYRPVVPKGEASRSVLRRVVGTFFAGSVDDAIAALLDMDDLELSEDDLKRIERMARAARGTAR